MPTDTEMLDWLNKNFLSHRNGIACDVQGWYTKRDPSKNYDTIRDAIAAAMKAGE